MSVARGRDDVVVPAQVVITPGGRNSRKPNANRVYVEAADLQHNTKDFYFPRKGNKPWLNIIYDALDSDPPNDRIKVNLGNQPEDPFGTGQYLDTGKVVKARS